MEYADISGAFNSLNYRKSELIIKYKQRKRAGIKRIWNCELIPQENIMDTIKMKINKEKGKGASQKRLIDNDKDLPKDDLIGLSTHEFFDCILSIALTKYGLQFEYQFICSDHFDAYLYKQKEYIKCKQTFIKLLEGENDANNNCECLIGYARCLYFGLKEFEAAEIQYKLAENLNEFDDKLYYELCLLSIELNKMLDAIEYIRQVIEIPSGSNNIEYNYKYMMHY